jgi:hypothetical protein
MFHGSTILILLLCDVEFSLCSLYVKKFRPEIYMTMCGHFFIYFEEQKMLFNSVGLPLLSLVDLN